MIGALRDSNNGVSWSVQPFCFAQGDAVLWEPSSPNDGIPYALASAGVEAITLLTGITEHEVTEFCRIITTDPLAGEGLVDLAQLLWEAHFEHIKLDLSDDVAEADAAEQKRSFAETDDLEAMAREDLAEVAAMAHATTVDGSALSRAPAAALGFDRAALTALGAQLSLEPRRWSDRFFDLSVDAFLEAQSRNDPGVVLDALATSANKFLNQQRFADLFALFDNLLRRLDAKGGTAQNAQSVATLAAGMFPERVLKELLNRLYARSDMEDGDRETALAGLRSVMTKLDSDALYSCMKLASRLPAGQPLDILMDFLQRAVSGRETEVVEQLDQLRPAFAQRMLAILASAAPPKAAEILQPLTESTNPALRCEAIALLTDSPQVLKQELLKLVVSDNDQIRKAALSVITRHQVRSAGPGLKRLVDDKSFLERSHDEQRLIFETLCSLNAERGEALLVSVVTKMRGIMASEPHDKARALAATILGQQADSDEAVAALRTATKRRPWNTAELRSVANQALDDIAERLAARAAAEKESAP